MTLGDRFDQIMDAARKGEEQAITALYQDVNPKLMRFLSARAPSEADDLAADVWLVLARRLPTFKGREQEWLGLVFLVARRRLNDLWKQRARRKTEPVDVGVLATRPSGADVEELGMASLNTQKAIAFVVDNLPPEQADVILLRVLADLDVEEVAGALRKRPGHVRVIQHRALKRLTAVLEEEAGRRMTRSHAPSPTGMAVEAAVKTRLL